MAKEAELSLLQAMIMLQSVVLSCMDRKQFPLTRTQQSVLGVLAIKGEMTMKQAAQNIATSQEQATRAVAPLVDAGYVERRTDRSNRTRVYIRLTDQGKQFLEERWTLMTDNLSDKLDRSLTEQEKSALCEAAETMVGLINKI